MFHFVSSEPCLIKGEIDYFYQRGFQASQGVLCAKEEIFAAFHVLNILKVWFLLCFFFSKCKQLYCSKQFGVKERNDISYKENWLQFHFRVGWRVKVKLWNFVEKIAARCSTTNRGERAYSSQPNPVRVTFCQRFANSTEWLLQVGARFQLCVICSLVSCDQVFHDAGMWNDTQSHNCTRPFSPCGRPCIPSDSDEGGFWSAATVTIPFAFLGKDCAAFVRITSNCFTHFREWVTEEGLRIIRNVIQPAYRRLRDFVKHVRIPERSIGTDCK